ncbi:hypothetical protein TSUD_15950 [Trifolium subterraneum]|uniref:Protein kinase domain-containing protein n=1 Tax=Trifolium subterraneum TaxID=3900 RepID=A0A2Z6NJ88_TRISU|nr:hypothetical protein TSUD_15950 [Trifolium subterraneum]
MDGVRSFTYEELSSATNNFSSSAQVGQGCYGKVYKGILSDGTVIAIKRAQEGSLQGEKEFQIWKAFCLVMYLLCSAQVGQGCYGKVYKGILSDGTVIAIKRAQEGSLQGEKEFQIWKAFCLVMYLLW